MLRRCLLLSVVTALIVTPACTERQDLEADTVRVHWSDRRADLEVISCGLDDDVFVLAAESASGFVQLLLAIDETGTETGKEADGEVDVTRSAVTAEVDVGVLGAGDAELLGVDDGVPGQITRARIRGDRIDVNADARVLGSADTSTVTLEIDARCSAVEELAGAAPPVRDSPVRR